MSLERCPPREATRGEAEQPSFIILDLNAGFRGP